MTADEFKAARAALGLSAAGMALALRLGAQGGRTVRRWEAGDSSIGGPVAIVIESMLAAKGLRIRPAKKIAKGA